MQVSRRNNARKTQVTSCTIQALPCGKIMSASSTIAKLFFERGDFVVVGLTGRTGSGCTTAAQILESDKPNFPALDAIKINGEPLYKGLDARRYLVLKDYAEA